MYQLERPKHPLGTEEPPPMSTSDARRESPEFHDTKLGQFDHQERSALAAFDSARVVRLVTGGVPPDVGPAMRHRRSLLISRYDRRVRQI